MAEQTQKIEIISDLIPFDVDRRQSVVDYIEYLKEADTVILSKYDGYYSVSFIFWGVTQNSEMTKSSRPP